MIVTPILLLALWLSAVRFAMPVRVTFVPAWMSLIWARLLDTLTCTTMHLNP